MFHVEHIQFYLIRDEAHSFGVKHHTHRRDNSLFVSLEKIPGLGPKTIQKLYKAFGSIQSIRNAGKEELIACVGKSKADLVWNHLENFPTDLTT